MAERRCLIEWLNPDDREARRDVDLNALHSVRSSGTVSPRLDRHADLFRLASLLPTDQASSGSKDGRFGGSPGKG